MNIETKKDFNRIIVKSEPFYDGMDFTDSLIERLQTYFLEKGFKITEINNKKIVVSRGNPITNMITFNMKKLRRKIFVEIDDNDRITIVSNIDTTGQLIRESEMNVFTFEVSDIVEFIQNKASNDASLKQNRKSTIENYAILLTFISIVIFGFYIVIRIIED